MHFSSSVNVFGILSNNITHSKPREQNANKLDPVTSTMECQRHSLLPWIACTKVHRASVLAVESNMSNPTCPSWLQQCEWGYITTWHFNHISILQHDARTPSWTSRSLENNRFPYIFHRPVVSCKFRSIFLQSLYDKYDLPLEENPMWNDVIIC
jgi:hypothetical protein